MRINNRKLRLWTNSYLTYKYMWPNIIEAVQSIKNQLPDGKKKVLDVGCGNKPYYDLFETEEYIGMDYNNEDTQPDVIGTADKIPFDDNTFDIVFSTQVIEHVPNPEKMCSECFRVLKPGGGVLISGPFYFQIHEAPYDFHRFTRYGFEHRLREAGFEHITIKEDGGTWAQIFLSICLRVPKWLFPLRIVLNITGSLMDKLFYDDLCPANYTCTAFKPKQ